MDKTGVGEIKVAGILREHLQITCKLVIVFYDCLTNLVSNKILTIADCHRLENKVARKKKFLRNKFADDHLEERVGNLQVVAVDGEEMQFPLSIHFLQSQQIFSIKTTLLQRLRLVDVAVFVEPEPLRLSRLHHRITQEFHHHEILQFHQILLVGGFGRSFLVDVGEKDAGLAIFVQVGRVVPVLGLDELVLNPRNISSKIEETPDVIADGGAISGAVRESIDALMLTSDGNEVQHRRIGTSLGHRTQKLTTLRKSHRGTHSVIWCRFSA